MYFFVEYTLSIYIFMFFYPKITHVFTPQCAPPQPQHKARAPMACAPVHSVSRWQHRHRVAQLQPQTEAAAEQWCVTWSAPLSEEAVALVWPADRHAARTGPTRQAVLGRSEDRLRLAPRRMLKGSHVRRTTYGTAACMSTHNKANHGLSS